MISIMLVEDEQADVHLIKRAMEESTLDVAWTHAHDGAEALSMLSTGDLPDLILADLNMPRMNGHDLLAHIKEHPDWRRIPVVILTTSDADHDVRLAYDRHANSYVVKPIQFKEFQPVVQALEAFWLRVARLPKG